jgi:hypothetical protein
LSLRTGTSVRAEGTHGHDDGGGSQVISGSRCAGRLPDSETGPCARFPPDRRTRSAGLSGTGWSTRTSACSRRGADSAVWRAFRDGNLVAYGFTLLVLLERLEALPEPLGQAAGWPGRAGWTVGRTRIAGVPRQERTARDSVRFRRDRVPARAVQGGKDRVSHRDGATCLPPPAGNPVQAGDARGWYYPRAPHTGQAPMPWPATTRWATAICWAGVARFADEAYRPPP